MFPRPAFASCPGPPLLTLLPVLSATPRPSPPLPLVRTVSEQSTEENRASFPEFVAAWNAGRLPARFYEGKVGAARTAHQWGFKGELRCGWGLWLGCI